MHNPLRQSVVLVVLSSLAASAVLAAKPPKNPPPPPLPPVRYQIQYWTIPGAIEVQDIYDTNSAGQTVGSFRIDLNGDGISDASRAYLYDPSVDTEFGIDLNLLVSNIPGTNRSVRPGTKVPVTRRGRPERVVGIVPAGTNGTSWRKPVAQSTTSNTSAVPSSK